MFGYGRNKAGRRWWQRLIRYAVVLAIFLMMAYVSLPIWLPTHWLKNRIAGDLARQTGLPVRIAGLSTSWRRGVRIDRLEIGESSEQEGQSMILVPQIRASFDPLRYVLEKKIDWMEIDQPSAAVRIDSEGNLNLAPLSKMESDITVTQLTVHRATATLELADQSQRLSMRINNVQYLAGRANEIGRITVSALLVQEEKDAPINLRIDARHGQPVAADLVFNFAHIDLAKLPIASLLDLPLEQLEGTLRGELSLQITLQGGVEQFHFNANIDNLNAQPLDGPELPLIKQAGFRIDARYPFAGLLDVESASIRLPGIDLAGQASLVLDTHSSRNAPPMQKDRLWWQAIDKLNLTGTLYPDQLAAMMGDRFRLPGQLDAKGPVSLNFLLEQTDTMLALDTHLNASAASLQWGSRELKPPGKTLDMRMVGRLDKRIHRLEIEPQKTRVHLGTNSLQGGFVIYDTRKFVERLSDAWYGEPAAWTQAMAMIQCQGQGTLSDLSALEPFAPDGSLPCSMEGTAHGTWSLNAEDQHQIHWDLHLEENALLQTPWFIKHQGQALQLSGHGKFFPELAEISHLETELRWGEALLRSYEGRVALSRKEEKNHYSAQGRIEGRFVESFLQAIPLWTPQDKWAIKGDFASQYALEISERFSGKFDLDLTGADLRVGAIFSKPKEEKAEIAVAVFCDPADPLSISSDIRTQWNWGTVAIQAITENDQPRSVEFHCDLTDVEKTISAIPLLADKLNGYRPGGKLRLAGNAHREENSWQTTLSLNADGLELHRQNGDSVKSPGVALNGQIAATLSENAEGEKILSLNPASLEWGQNRVLCQGQTRMDPSALLVAKNPIRELEFKTHSEIYLNENLSDLLPALHPFITSGELAGKVAIQLEVGYQDRRWALSGQCDADALMMDQFQPFSSISNIPLDMPGPLSKPDSMPAQFQWELSADSDLSYLKLHSLQMELGSLALLAGASVQFASDQDETPLIWKEIKGHVTFSSDKLEDLAILAPALKAYEPSGELFLDMEGTLDGRQQAQIKSIELHSQKLQASFKNRPVTIRGGGSLWDITLSPQKAWHIGRAKTEELGIHVGPSDFWIIADLENLPQQARGNFYLLGDTIDTPDLKAWLTDTPTPQHASRPYKLTPEQIESLQIQAETLIASSRDLLKQIKLTARISVNRLIVYDESVKQSYHLRNMEWKGSCENSHIQYAYVAGMNGGTMRGKYEVHADEPAPRVAYETSLQDVISDESIAPQLEKFFPGNLVRGLFNREERSTIALRDMLANLLDYRYPLRPEGEAKTITTDGVVMGRSAPKFVTRIFPGLNLTAYHYQKMTSFATFLPDGTAQNDMIFSGDKYDIYMEGTTDVENIGRYEIGLILLGTPQSAEWNHAYRQGRIPILKLKALIENGKMYNDTVSYPWPNETLFTIFLKNNIFYRIWLAAQKP